MSRIYVSALLALSAFAVPQSTVLAQFIPGLKGTSDISKQGSVHERDVPMCQAAPGGSRIRENCEPETTVLRAEKNVPIFIEIPPLPNKRECGATTTTESLQLNTVARINATLKIEDCTAASGAFTIALRIRDESGADKPLEFEETWQRSDAEDVRFTADYPIGENVDLLDVRMRALSCTCGDAAPAEEGSE